MMNFKWAFIIAIVLNSLGLSVKASTYKPYVAENGTYRGQINTKTYKPKNTYVKPYTKKSGSRTRSYYRTRKR